MDATNQNNQSAYAVVLTSRAFRHLWAGQICSQFAVSTQLFVLGLRIYQATGSNTAVSLLFLAYSVPALLFGLVAGTLVDRLDKRRVLMMCDLIRGLLVLGLFFLSDQVYIVYVLVFANSVITQLYVPSEAPLIPKLVPKHLLVSANSMFSFTFYSSLAVGSVMAGPLLRVLGHQRVFLFIAVLFWAAAWFSSRLPSQSSGTVGIRHVITLKLAYIVRRIWERLGEGVSYVRRTKSLFEAIMLLTGTQIIFSMLGTLGPGFADRVLTVDVRDSSLLVVGPAILGIVFGAIWIGNIGFRFGGARLIRWGVLSTGIILLLIGGSSILFHSLGQWWVFRAGVVVATEMCLLFFLGVANSLLDVPANAKLQEEAEGAMRGRVYGILGAFVGGVGVIPVMLGGLLADTIGIINVILLLGTIISAYGIFRIRYNT